MTLTSVPQKRNRDFISTDAGSGVCSGTYPALKKRAVSIKHFGRNVRVSGRSILPLFKCHSDKIYQFVFPDQELCTPFSLDFCNRRCDGQLLAVTDEDGRLSLLRVDKGNGTSSLNFHNSFYGHSQPITDVKWSRDDTMLLTAANDRLIRLWDTEFRSCLAEFTGHSDVVKSVNWHPTNPSLFITGSKDGSFKVWDTRFNQRKLENPDDLTIIPVYTPIKSVDKVHDTKTVGRRLKKSGPQPLFIRSVTSALFLNLDEDKVITSGSADGCIKLWDIRAGRTAKELASTLFVNEETGKKHGITDMKIDSSGTRLFSSCMDNSVYMHYLVDLNKPARKYADPEYKVSNFDVRLSLSHDDQFLLSSSYDKKLFNWEVDDPKAKAQVYEGHNDKVTGVCWSKTSSDQFASCSDDFTTRVWTSDI